MNLINHYAESVIKDINVIDEKIALEGVKNPEFRIFFMLCNFCIFILCIY
jgi:hypothetical protein